MRTVLGESTPQEKEAPALEREIRNATLEEAAQLCTEHPSPMYDVASHLRRMKVEPVRMDEHAQELAARIVALETQLDNMGRQLDQLIKERDDAVEWADKLASDIAETHDLQIGEHSNANNPWSNAWLHESEDAE